MEIGELHKRILINMRLLHQYGRKRCTLENIITRDYHSHVTPWPDNGIDHALTDLKHAGFVNQHSTDFELTQIGTKTALQMLENFFAKTMVESYHSRAAHAFRENLYGLDLYQHNISTRNQLNALRTYINPNCDKDLLDLGCGLGGIAEYFSEFGASLTGIDLAEDLIENAKKRTVVYNKLSLRFETHDIADYKPDQYYDGIYSIDAIQFLSEQQQVEALKTFYAALKPKGIMVFLYSQIVQVPEKTDKPKIIAASELRLGKALKNLGLKYEAVDFCDEYIPFWQRQCGYAEALSEDFKREGLEQLFQERLDEGNRILREVLSGSNAFGRYMYVVRKS